MLESLDLNILTRPDFLSAWTNWEVTPLVSSWTGFSSTAGEAAANCVQIVGREGMFPDETGLCGERNWRTLLLGRWKGLGACAQTSVGCFIWALASNINKRSSLLSRLRDFINFLANSSSSENAFLCVLFFCCIDVCTPDWRRGLHQLRVSNLSFLRRKLKKDFFFFFFPSEIDKVYNVLSFH